MKYIITISKADDNLPFYVISYTDGSEEHFDFFSELVARLAVIGDVPDFIEIEGYN